MRFRGTYRSLAGAWLLLNSALLCAQVSTVSGNENLPEPIKRMLYEEQVLHAKGLFPSGTFGSNVTKEYTPENRPVFKISYYLVSAKQGEILATKSLSPEIREQIIVRSGGTEYMKLFVHPESKAHYSYLQELSKQPNSGVRYVSAAQSEFTASPTSSFRSLILWQDKNPKARPFVAKVSLDRDIIRKIHRLVTGWEVRRSMSVQNFLAGMGKSVLNKMGATIFPETAGYDFSKSFKAEAGHAYLGGQIIREFSKEVIEGKVRWVTLATLMSPEGKSRPMIMDVIEKSGLPADKFIEKLMIDKYMGMYQKLSAERGQNFEPHSQNLTLELDKNLKPGNFVLKDFGGMLPDLVKMIAAGVNTSPFHKGGEANMTFKMSGARGNYINSYVYYYRNQVFSKMLEVVAKHDPSFKAKIPELTEKLDNRFLEIMQRKVGYPIQSVPLDYRMMKYERSNLGLYTPFKLIEAVVKEIPNSGELQEYLKTKRSASDFVTLDEGFKKFDQAKYYLGKDGVFVVYKGFIKGYAVFNELEYSEKGAPTKGELRTIYQSGARRACDALSSRAGG